MHHSTAYSLGRRLLDDHGLGDWQLVFDRAKRRAGACRFRDRTISLSHHAVALQTEEQVTETVLHEVAHAKAGPRAGHGPEWQRIAASVGASPARCLPPDVPMPEGDLVGCCPAGHRITRHRRPTRVLLCSTCRGLPSRERTFDWTYLGAPVPMLPTYTAELQLLDREPSLTPGTVEGLVAIGSLAPGSRVRLREQCGRWAGREGLVAKVNRTRYVIRLPEGQLSVPFGLVTPLGEVRAAASGRPRRG